MKYAKIILFIHRPYFTMNTIKIVPYVTTLFFDMMYSISLVHGFLKVLQELCNLTKDPSLVRNLYTYGGK